jgi:hypothetical protein
MHRAGMCGCHDALACTGVHAEVIFGVRLAHPARIRGGRCTRRPYQSLMLMLVGSQISCPTTAGMPAGHQHSRCRARCGAAMAVGSISAMEARAMAVPLPTTEEMIDDEEMMNTTLSLRLGRVRGQSPYGSVCCRPGVWDLTSPLSGKQIVVWHAQAPTGTTMVLCFLLARTTKLNRRSIKNFIPYFLFSERRRNLSRRTVRQRPEDLPT